MKTVVLAALMAIVAAAPAHAALKPGDRAPDFKALASLGGKEFTFSLADALKKGPVVLYFYPAAFTPGCTIEAHEFAEAVGKFQALGASVIGVSHDNIATLDKFSTSECRSKFPVAADEDGSIIKSYDAAMMGILAYADRTSYVIAPDGDVVFEYSAMDPTGHVEKTLAAVQDWRNKTH
ncbi:MAG: peroxiredoxin [Proteobacteria bacterium]|nr:peroxiredoxin [Pseudomonadota bacterium]